MKAENIQRRLYFTVTKMSTAQHTDQYHEQNTTQYHEKNTTQDQGQNTNQNNCRNSEPDAPNLSIIIPVFNGEHYIENTVCSVLNSSWHDLELLLIDDGSTDSSLAICNRLAEADTRIKVYHKANGGIAEARNYGLIHARGNHIGFCDQDDEVHEEMYQKMLERIALDGSQAAICGCYRQKRSGKCVTFQKYTDDVFEGPQIRQKLLLPMLFKGFAAYANDEISIYTSIWNCVISRQLIEDKKMRFNSFVNYEDDLIMLLQLLLKADRISTLSDIFYYWNTNTHSESHHSAVRYIPDLESKQQNLIDYITGSLTDHEVSPEVIAQYIYVQHCRNALLQLDNMAALNDCKFHRKMKDLRICSCIRYVQSSSYTVKPAKGFIRNTILIPMLCKNHVAAAYVLNQLLNALRLCVEKYQITEKMERMLKNRTA